MPKYDYDLIIIGGGVSGYTAATFAAGLGKRVLVVEKETSSREAALRMGLPAKTLTRAAAAADTILSATKYGLSYPRSEINVDGVLPAVRAAIDGITIFNRSDSLRRLGIAYRNGSAAFLDRHRISIEDSVISASKFIIATGSRPAKHPNLKSADAPYLTSETFFHLEKLPKSIIIVGGGPTGIELAVALRLLNLEVTIVEASNTILGAEDREMADLVATYLASRGIIIYEGHKPTTIHKVGGSSRVTIVGPNGEQDIQAESVLLAIGREANIEGLSLEKAGVEHDTRTIKVNKTLRTTASNIYACGDVTGRFQLVEVAEHEGLIAANNTLLPLKQSVNLSDVVWTIFTHPPLAHVGQTEEEVKADYGFAYKVYRQDYKDIGRSQLDLNLMGRAKYIVGLNGRLLGAHIFGADADAAAHELQVLKSLHKPFWSLRLIKHAFPTYEEGLLKRTRDIAYLEKLAANPWFRLVLNIMPGFHNNLDAVIKELNLN